jgi:hypothetical protein
MKGNILYDSDRIPIFVNPSKDSLITQTVELAALCKKKLVDWVLFGSITDERMSFNGINIMGLSVIDGSISDIDFTGCIYNASTSFDGVFFTNCKFEDNFLQTVRLEKCSTFYSKELSFIPSKQIKILKRKKVIIFDLDNTGYYGDNLKDEEE